MLEAFCHELVHFKQHTLGQLGAYKDKSGQWMPTYMGVPVEVVHAAAGGVEAYLNQPWEKEAHAEMGPLAEHCVLELCRRNNPDLWKKAVAEFDSLKEAA